MIITAHQPDFLPYLGLFERIYYSDMFVIFDNVQYQFGYFNNRNKIKTGYDKWQYITVPVKAKMGMLIKDVEINNEDTKWKKKLLQSISQAYSKAPFFKPIFDDISDIINRDYKNLADMNIELLMYIIKGFKFNVDIKILSCYNEITTTGEKQVVDMCKFFNGTEYISGVGGKNYQKEENFEKQGIKLTYVDFANVEYAQRYGEFMPYMSIIDYLFNCGFEIPEEWKRRKENGIFI